MFGGAKMSANLSDIGAANADFVQRFLRDEGIPVISSSVGGTSARRVRFHACSGAAQQTHVKDDRKLGELELARRRTSGSGPCTGSGRRWRWRGGSVLTGRHLRHAALVCTGR